MSKPLTLDHILNTHAIHLEHDGIAFRLVPFSNARVAAWNRATFTEHGDLSALEKTEKVMQGQLDVITAHLRECVTDGKAQRVTSKWVSEQFPQTLIQDLAVYFAQGEKPSWAKDEEAGQGN